MISLFKRLLSTTKFMAPSIRFVFSYEKRKDSISLKDFFKIEQFIKFQNISCKGCGIPLQISDSSLSGYTDPSFINQKLSAMNQDSLKEPQNEEKNDFENIRCKRCHEIRFYNKPQNLLTEEKNLQSMSLDLFIEKIYKEVKAYSLILYLIDLSNLSATIIPRLLTLKEDKKCKIWIIVNKIDVLPNDFDLKRVKPYIKKYLEKSKFSIPEEDIFFVSSVTGTGFHKLLARLKNKKLKNESENSKPLIFKRGYVIGCTNTGKSTFINCLIRNLKPYFDKKYQNPFTQDKNEEDQLTVSPMPNTTLKTHEIENLPSRFRFFDTPGIPNEITMGNLMGRLLRENNSLVIKKKIKPERIDLSSDKTIFLGGLMRIDFPYKAENWITEFVCHFYCSYDVSLHKTQIEKANEVYLKHYGELLKPVFDENIKNIVFKKNEIKLTFSNNGECEQILEIYGLGWIRFSLKYVNFKDNTKNSINIVVYLPEGVLFKVRDTMASLIKNTNIRARIKNNLQHRKEISQKIFRKVLNRKKTP